MVTPLLSTKYHLPPAAQDWVQRARLLARLDELLLPSKRLGLVSGLAGSGKTTLVRSWVEHNHDPGSLGHPTLFRVAWLSLDEEDNDLAVFLAYLIAALQTACPEIDLEGNSGFTPGASYTTPPVRFVLGNVVNRLADLPDRVIMVFDDYHAISATAIHEALTFLLDHLPDPARLVVITRAESLLPVSRLRARGQLVEIREADLRFTATESAVWLNGTMGLDLNPAENQLLVERTEGWAAGLQMAAMALKSLPDAAQQTGEFVQSFSGSNRFVLDYLMDEVFSRLPLQTQSFLLKTAILDRFCPDLCRAVMGEVVTEAPSTIPVEDQLSFLSQSHLFIIPLDDERCWYRYHHLFGELLRNRMRHDVKPGEIVGYQRRAGEWFAGQGLIPEAIHYLLLSKDFEQAASLIEGCAQEVISSGRLTTPNQWLAALPALVFVGRPRLHIFLALTSFLKGDSAAAIAILEDTRQALDELPVTDSTQLLKRELISILALSKMTGGNSQQVLSLVQDALDSMPETELIPRARLLFSLGMACAMSSDERYYTLIEQAVELARKAGDLYLAANILNMQAMGAVFFQARYRSAWQLYDEIIHMCSPAAGEALPLPASLGYIGQAAIALEWDDLDLAASLLDKGADFRRQAGQLNPSLSALIVQARLKQAKGDLQSACADLEEATSDRAFDDNIAAVASLAQAQVCLHLACGQFELAEQCAAGMGLPPASQPGPRLPALVQEVWGVLQARVLLAIERPAEALAILNPIVPQAKSASRMTRVIEGGLYQALALYALQRDALEPLRLALTVGRPQGITRLFLESGTSLHHLLLAYRPRLGELSDEVDRLLHLLGGSSGSAPNFPAEMVKPLTAREMDVLRLLSEGRSNQEIAATLFLSLSSIKKHTGNLYSKLGVTSRAQAIVKARQLRLV
jgi:LuxR family transcriptional regulator, maltose regulon positive regulatory protein